MSWKDTLKKSIKKLAFPDVSYSDINEMLDITDFAHQDAHVPSSPPSQWRQKISDRDRKARYLEKPSRVKDKDEECPPGELWCEKHEECESEKYWLTHNRQLTEQEVENQKQFEASGKLSGS